jgi:hypothetical protein
VQITNGLLVAAVINDNQTGGRIRVFENTLNAILEKVRIIPAEQDNIAGRELHSRGALYYNYSVSVAYSG